MDGWGGSEPCRVEDRLPVAESNLVTVEANLEPIVNPWNRLGVLADTEESDFLIYVRRPIIEPNVENNVPPTL